MSLPSEDQSLLADQILSRYLKWRLRYKLTTSGFKIQTSAILECCFWFRSRPVRRNLHVILYQVTAFRPNRSTHCGNMTSYLFLKMAAATAKYYFRFRICWCHCIQTVKGYQQTKFRRDISIGGWDIITSGFEIQTSGFDLDHFTVIGVSFCIRLPNFVQIGISAAEIWRHIDFQDGGRQPCCICFGVMADHLRSAFRGLNSDLKSLVRRIRLIVPEILRCKDFGVLAWYCLFTPLFAEFLGNIFPIWRHPSSWPQNALPRAETRHLSHSA